MVVGAMPTALMAATAPGTQIDNQAFVFYQNEAGDSAQANSNVVSVTTVFGRTPSATSFTRLAAGSGSLSETVGPSACFQGGSFAPQAAPIGLNGQPLDTAAVQLSNQTGLYNTDETAFVRLDDGDQNLDANVRETVEVTVRNSDSGDNERLQLLETDVNTGIFTGYVALADTNVVGGNCVLEGAANTVLALSYSDPADAQDVSQALALVEPLALVFDSMTGLPIDGATITLIDESTGLPAQVFGNDGVSAYPATVVSGATATDASGLVYVVPVGGFRFPVIAPGRYRLQVIPPTDYVAPSSRSIADLNMLPGAPFDLSAASFGTAFDQTALTTTLVDIPLDPFNGGLFLSKTTTTSVAAVGDFVRYELVAENTSDTFPATGVIVRDTLPSGFKVVAGSVRANGVVSTDPVAATDGSAAIEFALADIPAGEQTRLTYVVEITGGAKGKRAVNFATAIADRGLASNEASVGIALREDLFRSTSTLIGRVVEGDCSADTFSEESGIEGVRIYMEDGRYAVTDAGGRYHMEGLTPGRRVVQMDALTIPEYLELVPCESAPRFGSRADSQWVHLQQGQLQRGDFYLRRKAPNEGRVDIQLVNRGGSAPDTVEYELIISGQGDVNVSGMSATVLLPPAVTLRQASTRLNGRALPNPRSAGNAVVFMLGDYKGKWRERITFSADVDKAYAGELVTRAVANFNTPAAQNQRTPVGEARMLREAASTENADYVLSLNFDVLSAELSQDDRKELDALIAAWRGVYDIEIHAIGHTDSDGIARRNQHVFADNYALSKARAGAAALYVASTLNVDPSAVNIEGRGADQPVASNATSEGKKRNRRVEMVMMGTRPGRQSVIEVTKEQSGVLAVDTLGDAPGPDSATDPLDEKMRAISALSDNSQSAAEINVEKLTPSTQWLKPSSGFQPAIPSLSIAIQHGHGTRVELAINGNGVSPLNFDGSQSNRAKTLTVSQWRGVDLVDGENVMIATIYDASGALSQTLRRSVHYAGHPIRGEFVAAESRLLADGRKRPVVAVRLFDAEGQPARASSIGGYRVDQPYRSWFEIAQEKENRLVAIGEREPFYRVGPDGIAYIELEPTTRAGEVTLHLKFNNNREQEIRAFLKPEPRDWIMVAIAEGTVGYNTISDNLQAATAAGQDEDFYQDGRVAFFAKGRVKGEFLLTMAYDTRGAAVDRDQFEDQIDPDEYFTLYGDGTESRMEAASQNKLYVKLERGQFAALFGDFDTAMSVTELARYQRKLSGLQSEYHGERFGYTAFAAESNQGFKRDDIAGDGTSGLYRLNSAELVINSERVRIETRDRFNAANVIASENLSRHVDYDIDYRRGTLFFKHPIPSRDESFNPIVIVVEYETRGSGEQEITAGGRASVKLLDGDFEVGASAVREGNAVDENVLLGMDLRWQITDETLLRAEYADTQSNDLTGAESGYAWLVELAHRSGALDARAFTGLTDGGFGLGQQSASQTGVEQTGLEARWQFAEQLRIEALLGHQENLDTGTQRDLAEAELRFESARLGAFAGVAYVSDEAEDGRQKESALGRAGVSRKFGKSLTARFSLERALSSSAESLDYPERSVLGLDWDINAKVTAFGEYEIAEGADIDAQTTRVGLRASPWSRARFTTTLDNEITEFGPRTFANLGFVQGWQVSERWVLDFGVDHSNTLVGADALVIDGDRELASGSQRADFVAGFVGALYQADAWSANSRIEQRSADDEDRLTVLAGWYREPVAGHGFSAGVQYFDSEQTAGSSELQADVRLGWAYRKADRRWAFLDRLDLIVEERVTVSGSARSTRFINNFNAVRRLDAGSELSLQYAAKYVRSEFDGEAYTGYTDLIGADYRKAFRPRWDFGLHGSVLHSWESDVIDYSLGADIGFNPRDNLWISLGYNVVGFRDADFDNARYTAQGPYLNVMIKADQQTLKQIAGLLTGRGSSTQR